jgi:hypothetical protein
MAGGHDHGSHDTHKKSGGGGGGPGFTERVIIPRIAMPLLIIVLVGGFLLSIAEALQRSHGVISIPRLDTLFGGQDDDEIRGCIPPKIAPWPCHDPKQR